jgi:hypothetical protein
VADETPVLDLIVKMNADSIEAADLDPRTLMLVRIAALVAVDAPPMSYLANLGIAGEMDVELEDVQSVLMAVAPIVGSARVVAATGSMVKAGLVAGLAGELGEGEPA